MRKTVWSWALYDFANSAFTTLVVTFIFSTYFTQSIASDPERGTVLWARAVNISAIAVALVIPLLGAIADYSARKKLFLLISTLICSGATAMLFFTGEGTVTRALVLFVIANIGFEAGNVFYNAFLPEISTRENIGRISGMGWALGYGGGLLCLLIALWMIQGGVVPDTGGFDVRATNLLVAVWGLAFSIPLFLHVKEKPRENDASTMELVKIGMRRLKGTVAHLRQYREAGKLLLAHLVYNDGLATVFAFAAIYAAATFGMQTSEVIVLGIVLNLVSGIGAFGFGFINDRIGGKKTIAITLVFLVIATGIGAMAQTKTQFWIGAILLGLMIGPNQAASRSLLGVFVPENKHAEMFGFFAFSGKLASVAGPLTYGLVLQSTGSQRLAIGSVAVFFIVGLVLLTFIDEKRGIALAEHAPE